MLFRNQMEHQIPAGARRILTGNPMFILVRGYRSIFLEGHAPDWNAILGLTFWSLVLALLAHGWFYSCVSLSLTFSNSRCSNTLLTCWWHLDRLAYAPWHYRLRRNSGFGRYGCGAHPAGGEVAANRDSSAVVAVIVRRWEIWCCSPPRVKGTALAEKTKARPAQRFATVERYGLVTISSQRFCLSHAVEALRCLGDAGTRRTSFLASSCWHA